MRRQGGGHIVNITSIGGKISVPHMLPYSAAKFAAVGFSEGFRRGGCARDQGADGRAGSDAPAPRERRVQRTAPQRVRLVQSGGQFAFHVDVRPDAARQVVDAIVNGESEIILTWQAALAVRVHGLMPGLSGDVLSLVNRLLPCADDSIGGATAHPGSRQPKCGVRFAAHHARQARRGRSQPALSGPRRVKVRIPDVLMA